MMALPQPSEPRDASGRDRAGDGRFEPFGGPLDTIKLELTRATYQAVLAVVAALQGLDVRMVREQLARHGAVTSDRQWVAASRTRELALYLVNTGLNVEQHFLARAAGVEPATVCTALRRVEDRRDDPQVERLITLAEDIVKGGQ